MTFQDKKKAIDQSHGNKPVWFVVLMIVLGVLFIYLQVILWIGEGSVADVSRLKQSIAQKEQENKLLQERNQKLIEEVEALRNGLELIEHKAREDLGLVKENEVFYHVIDERTPGSRKK